MDATAQRKKPFLHPVTLDDLLGRLDSEGIDEVEGVYRKMRELFTCPFTVRDDKEFEDVLFDFYAHRDKTFYNFDLKSRPDLRFGAWVGAVQEIRKALGGVKGYYAAETNARKGREGGMIAVIDRWTESMIRDAIDSHIELIFGAHVPSGGEWLCYGDELLERYGKFLFPDEELIIYPMRYKDLVELIRVFVLKRHEIRNHLARTAGSSAMAPSQEEP